MSPLSRLPRHAILPLILLTASLGLAASGLAQPSATSPSTPVVGSGNTVTADPPLPRPRTTPCTVQLFANFQFADFSPKPFTYTPPAACPGPWAKVILSADFSITAGRQFDRTAEIALGHTNLYFGTTAEPSGTVARNWHVERDLTDYSPLFATGQTGEVNLGNLVNSTFTGILSGSAVLQFYPVAKHEPAPRTADTVISLSTGTGGTATLANTSSVLAPTLSLPTNVEAAYLDVIPQSQSGDEFWYTCVLDDVAGELASCGGTAFREVEVTVDGQPAGVAPVYPWIFTGGIDPLLWRPIPGVQTLNFQPYRVDLTPFAGVLANGQPHQVGVRIYNANNFFVVAASLLLYQDHGASHVTGAVTRNTLSAAPSPVVEENLTTAPDGTITGTVTTTSKRQLTISGYVNTSHGKVETTVAQSLDFTNRQDFTVSATRFTQNITQGTKIDSGTETRQGGSVALAGKHLSYPLTLDIDFVANADGSGAQTTTYDQKFDSQEARVGKGIPFVGTVTNHAASVDTLLFDASGSVTGFANRKSSQDYFSLATDSGCYSRSITAQDGLLATVTDGKGCLSH
ncbi:MAG: hypothetical protein QOJ16_2678 [Acidobacteriota bacterium]|jgi:hypothetical protein|nr:hypothetical protein [Acidobacteriota bacterium]